MPECLDIAKEIHASVYSTNPSYQINAITTHYRQDASFDDPLVSVTGLSAILAQFRFLTVFSAISSHIYSISTTSNRQRQLVTVDALVTFWILFLPIRVRTLTQFTFDDQGFVFSHLDIWSLKDLISDSILGSPYDWFRSLNGSLSSFVIERVVWALERVYGNGDDVHRLSLRRQPS